MEKDILPLVLYPDKRLLESSEAVKSVDDEVRKNFDQLIAGINYYDGAGLAGVQLGIMKKIFVVDYDSISKHDRKTSSTQSNLGSLLCMANVEILEKSADLQDSIEGCLSLPGIYITVPRAAKIKVKYLDYNNNEQILDASGLLAFCIQHEDDHTYGKLSIDYLSPFKRRLAIKKLEKVIKQITRNRKDKLYF